MARSGWLEYGGAEDERTEAGLDRDGRNLRSLRRIGGVRGCGDLVPEAVATGGGDGGGGGGGGVAVMIKDA